MHFLEAMGYLYIINSPPLLSIHHSIEMSTKTIHILLKKITSYKQPTNHWNQLSVGKKSNLFKLYFEFEF